MSLAAAEPLSAAEAIETRHSVRQYLPQPVPREDLDEILRLAGLAPSSNNIQPWRFIVVTDPELKEQLRAAAFDLNQRVVESAPALIVVVSDMEDVMAHPDETVHPNVPPEQREQRIHRLWHYFGSMTVQERGQYGLTQANIALGYLMLAATGLGYATVPMLGFDRAAVRQVLGLKEHVGLASVVAIGRSAEPGYPHHRHPLDRIVTYR